MSQVFHGVVACTAEAQARSWFASIRTTIPLRLIRLDDETFAVYAHRRGDGSGNLAQIDAQLQRIPGELQRLAALWSQVTGKALLYWYDSRVGPWYQLFERGRMTREYSSMDTPKRAEAAWGKKDPLEVIGADRALHQVIEEAFLYDLTEPLAALND